MPGTRTISALRNTPPARMRAPWRWALGGALAGGLAALVGWAPAHWLGAGLAWASDGQVQLRESRGSVWNGSAQWVLTGGTASRDQMALPGRVQWQLRPSFTGLSLRWHADCCMQQPWVVRISVHRGGLSAQLQAHESRWPASLLTGLGTPWNTIQPQGQLVLRTPGMVVSLHAGRMQLQGSAELDVLHASSRLSTLQPLGSYRMRIEGGNMTTLALNTLEGALHMTGQGQWVGQRLRFQGEAWAAEGSETALANLLTMIGLRNGKRVLLSLG